MLKPGDEIDIWVVDRALGQGGMGSVYRCHNREARRILAAVKVLDASLGRQALAKARFVREAEILFSLDHPGIVKVRNVRMDLAMPYLEMEFIDGVNLEARIQAGPMPVEEALPIFRQVADALAYLHARGIRHRDIKPSNIVIQASGTIKLVDFGIATEADGATITQQGQTFGSVSYAPPEWLDPAALDPVRWDIYAAGVVFYEVLTGVQAFPMVGAGSIQQQVVRIMTEKQRRPPLDPGPTFPRALRALVRDMTRPDSVDRIAEAEIVRKRLVEVDLTDIDPSEAAAGPAPDVSAVRSPAGATMVPDFDPTDEDFAPPAGGALAALAGAGPVPNLAAPAVGAAVDRLAPTIPDAPQRTAALPGADGTIAGAPGASDTFAPEERPRASRRAPALGLLAAGLLGAGLLAAVGAWLLAPPPTRDVLVSVSGLPDGAAWALRLDGRTPEGVEGGVARFAAVAPGDHALRAAVGAGCAAADDDPAWCVASTVSLAVEADADPLAHTLPLAPPSPRAVRVALKSLPADAAPTARLGELSATGDASGVTLPEVAPGAYTLTVALGTCPDTADGCASGGSVEACPEGCSSWRGDVVVPAGEGTVELPIDLPAPAAPQKADTRTRGAFDLRPVDDLRVRPGGARVVTSNMFARWLQKRTEWAPEAARAAGKADGSYLSGWSDTTPPAGKESHAVVNVSWAAANAYCAGRGGLPGVDDAPQTWTESSTQPWHEYRSDGGRPAWRRSDGATSRAVKPNESGAFIGFRCAR